jgi:hypothetical protein
MNHAFHFALLLGLACLTSSSSTTQAAYGSQLCNTVDGTSRSAPDGSLSCHWQGSGNGTCAHDHETQIGLCSEL